MGEPVRRARTELGSYLRTRREATDPESLGLPRGRRRVEGLRREEVATFAGVGVDYYTRLEQGREAHPSAQLLGALSRVFRMNDDERLHLYRLAGADPADRLARGSREVPPETMALLDRWPMNPAFLYDDTQEIVVANALGRALHQGFARTDNFARMIFLDPYAKGFFVDWEIIALNTVGALRQAWGKASARAAVQEVIDELVAADTAFARLWATHTVVGKSNRPKRLRHPIAGELTLEFHHFTVPPADGLHLLVCDAAPGSEAEQSLRLLGDAAPLRD